MFAAEIEDGRLLDDEDSGVAVDGGVVVVGGRGTVLGGAAAGVDAGGVTLLFGAPADAFLLALAFPLAGWCSDGNCIFGRSGGG